MRTLLITVLAAAALFAQGTAPVDAELEKGRQLLQQREYFAALKQYQRVNQLAGGKSADAFLGMALAAEGMKVFKNALDAAQSAIEFAAGNSRLLARAHKLRGQIYAATGEPPHA
jgi:tetratricopeptide (TPR) repeat protein